MSAEYKNTDPGIVGHISNPLRDAERSIGLALSRLSDMGPGSKKAWIGAWEEYQKIAQLMVKTRSLADRIEQIELRVKRARLQKRFMSDE